MNVGAVEMCEIIYANSNEESVSKVSKVANGGGVTAGRMPQP